MSDPTRAQILANVTQPTFLVEYRPAGTWLPLANVLRVEQTLETGGGPNGLASGTTATPQATIELGPEHRAATWALVPVRVSYGFATSARLQRFTGVVVGREITTDTVIWQVRGFDALLERVEIFSPLFFARPIATETSISSVDDPTNSLYAAGLVNYIFWEAGGRPVEQAASYPDAAFYYACTHAVIAPEWSWIAGENAWAALQRACRACGGQIYQDGDGVMRYVDPLSYGTGTVMHAYTDAALTEAQRISQDAAGYADISSRSDVQEAVSAVSCTYTSRRAADPQVVYDDRTPRRILASTTASYDLDTQLPILPGAQVAIVASRQRGGGQLTPAQAPVTITSERAQRVTISVQNTLAEPIQLHQITVTARPVSAGESGSARASASAFGPFASELPLEDNALVQTRRHALALCRMTLDFAGQPTTVVTLTGCGYDPDRFVGELVNLTSTALGLTNSPHRIVALRAGETGAVMDVDLAPVSGIPTRASVWIVGTSYSGSDQRRYSY